MTYRDNNGIKRGSKGGVSSKNHWPSYYKKVSNNSSLKNAFDNVPDVRNVGESEAHKWEKEEKQREKYYKNRGYDPDDSYAHIDIELDGEMGPD
jgi:hypothetical protein